MELQDLSAEEARRRQRKLHALKTDCGCKVGALVLLLSMAAYVDYFFYAHTGVYSRQQEIIAGCVIFFGSALVGKSLGLLVARYRYKLLKKKLDDRASTLYVVHK